MNVRIIVGVFSCALWLHLWGSAKISAGLRRLLRPGQPDQHVTGLEGLQTARTALGLVILVVAHLFWSTSLSDSVGTSFGNALTTPVIVAVLVVVCALSMVACARRGLRTGMLRQLCIPIATVVVVLGIYAAAVFAMTHVPTLLTAAQKVEGALGVVAVIVMLSVGTTFIWAFFVSGYITVREISRHHFRAADGHPALRAIIIIAISCWSVVTVVANQESVTSAWRLPGYVALLVVGFGPLLNIVISLVEIRRLRTLHGISLRAPGHPVPVRW